MQSNIVHRFATALATAGHELHARVMLSAMATKALPTSMWAAAPGFEARTTERSTGAVHGIDDGAER